MVDKSHYVLNWSDFKLSQFTNCFWISGWLQTNPIVITICELPNTFALFTKIIANLPVNTTLLTWNWWEDTLPSVRNKIQWFLKSWQITLWEPIVKCEKLPGTTWMELLLLPEPFWPSLGNLFCKFIVQTFL